MTKNHGTNDDEVVSVSFLSRALVCFVDRIYGNERSGNASAGISGPISALATCDMTFRPPWAVSPDNK
jgi:hypothetical protein